MEERVRINIAIDGTAGSGKGTVSKELAKRLGIFHLDTGAIYRSIAFYVLENKISPNDEKNIEKMLKNMKFSVIFEKDNGNMVQKNLLNGEDLKQKIRTEEVSEASSIVSQYKDVREFATSIQHEIAKNYDVIIEGRDIGTVVLPNATHKFFLTASPEVRAKRRIEQLGLPGNEFENVLKEIKERDKRDSLRAISPLKVAEDAIYVDNSNQTIEQTVDLMEKYIVE